MVRIIFGVVVGVVAAFAVITAAEYMLSFALPLFPAPADPPLFQGPVVALPFALKILIVAGWLLGALAGAVTAGWIARRSATGWVPAALVALGGIANVAMILHPLWMTIAAVVAPLAGGWIGVRLARARV